MTPSTTTYSDRACVDTTTGSPSNVPPGLHPTEPPPHFLQTCGGKADKATRMYAAHLKWRSDADIGTIHRRSHPHFSDIKEAYPHFIHGRSKRGMPVCYEQPGKMDLKSLFKRGLQVADMIHHLVYSTEYMTHVLRPIISSETKVPSEPLPGCIVVMDVGGIGMSQLSGDLVSYLSAAGNMQNANYPGCQKRTIIINAPFWFKGAWGGVNKFMSQEVRDAACVCGKEWMSELGKDVDLDQIPKEYGGTSPHGLKQHPYEVQLCDYVRAGNHFAAAARAKEEDKIEKDAPSKAPLRNFDAQHFMFSPTLNRWVPDEESNDFDSPARRRLRSYSFEDETLKRTEEWVEYGGNRYFDAFLLVGLMILFFLSATG